MSRKTKKDQEQEPEMEMTSFYYAGALPYAEPEPIVEKPFKVKEVPNCIVVRLSQRLDSVNERLDSIMSQMHQYGTYKGDEPFFQEMEKAKKQILVAKSQLKGDRISKLKMAIAQLEELEKL